MTFSMDYATLLSLDQRFIVRSRTQVQGYINLKKSKKQRILFSEPSWPLGHLRFFLGLEIVIAVDQKYRRVMPIPLELQPERIRQAVPLQCPPDDAWVSALPCITDRVEERPTELPKKRRFFSHHFLEQIKRQSELEQAQQRMAQLADEAELQADELLKQGTDERILEQRDRIIDEIKYLWTYEENVEPWGE